MLDFVIFYVFVGFVLNTGLSLYNLYRGQTQGYVLLPEPFIYFLTIFSWPKTLWDLIASFNRKDETDEG